MRRVYLLVLGGCALLGLAAAAGAAERVPALARFRLKDPHSPTFYLRYQDRKLWITQSFAALKTARPLRLVRTRTWYEAHNQLFYRDREYAPVEVAGPIGRFSSVRMQPIVTVLMGERGGRPVLPEGDFEFAPIPHFLYRDRSGATWDYACFAEVGLVRTNMLEKTELVEMTVPDPTWLTLDLYVYEGTGSISLEVVPMVGPEPSVLAQVNPPPSGKWLEEAKRQREPLQGLRRNGKVFPLRLTITDAHGKVVHSAAGDLRKFARHTNPEGLTESLRRLPPQGPLHHHRRHRPHSVLRTGEHDEFCSCGLRSDAADCRGPGMGGVMASACCRTRQGGRRILSAPRGYSSAVAR